MRRVVSTNPRLYSPCHGDSRLLAISHSSKIHIFASLCLGICGTSIAHNIEVIMTCLCPFYHSLCMGELLYLYILIV
ncbi:hypothetical protein VTK73DRAFT_4351 [Phialemonium thermophilum]|uniref:Uncharacterized protein n=1 Tax=Phialemonium thermophilum TaxID=223376 RepID=A0ABR3WU50_9PEZI